MNQSINQSISIVTAFFDIGRGNIPEDQGYPAYMKRTNETYFEYFSYLAKLENEMVVFTQPEHKERILKLRENRKTTVVTLDLAIFKKYIDKIAQIQQDEFFKSKVNKDLLKNIEYWSPEYVLVNNLKSVFCHYACRKKLVSNDLVAWVDFGYVRNVETLNNVKNWEYHFNPQKFHLFSITKKIAIKNINDIYEAIFNNKPSIIGGILVGTHKSWQAFYSKIRQTQKKLLSNNIIDDDQGVMLYTLYENKGFFKVNYLGKNDWFSAFRRFDKTAKISLWEKIKDLF